VSQNLSVAGELTVTWWR